MQELCSMTKRLTQLVMRAMRAFDARNFSRISASAAFSRSSAGAASSAVETGEA